MLITKLFATNYKSQYLSLFQLRKHLYSVWCKHYLYTYRYLIGYNYAFILHFLNPNLSSRHIKSLHWSKLKFLHESTPIEAMFDNLNRLVLYIKLELSKRFCMRKIITLFGKLKWGNENTAHQHQRSQVMKLGAETGTLINHRSVFPSNCHQ